MSTETDTDTSESWETLRAEATERIDRYELRNRPDEAVLKASLHAFLEWLPEKGRAAIARDIKNSRSDDTLYRVFRNLLTCLAAPMKARSGPLSATDSPDGNGQWIASRYQFRARFGPNELEARTDGALQIFDEPERVHALIDCKAKARRDALPSVQFQRQQQIEDVASTLDQPSTTEEFRNNCLKRDGYCCVVTKQMDTKHWNKSDCPAGIAKGPVEAAHIIPFAYAQWDNSSAPPNDTASAWSVLYQCFPDVRKAGMKPENINDPSNGITLRKALLDEFWHFSLAFNPTEKENLYKLKVFERWFSDFELLYLPPSREVEFQKAQDAQDVELPSAALLDCHWRLSEILNASGMAEVIEKHLRDWDDIKGSAGGSLREDGSTDLGHILQVGLWERVVG